MYQTCEDTGSVYFSLQQGNIRIFTKKYNVPLHDYRFLSTIFRFIFFSLRKIFPTGENAFHFKSPSKLLKSAVVLNFGLVTVG